MRQPLSEMIRSLRRMTPALALCGIVTVSAAISLSAVVKPKPKPATPPVPPMVIRYEGKQEEKYSGKKVLMVYGVDLSAGKEMKWIVPPADMKAKTYTPDPKIMDYLDQLKEGDYAKIKMHSKYNDNWLEGIDFYKMTPGEELPGNFVFYETYEKKESDPHVQIVTLQKFGQAYDLVLPMKTDGKESVIDPGMLATVNAIKKGDVVSADAVGGDLPVLKYIDPYVPPAHAKISKVVESDVTDTLKGPAVEVDEDGKSVTLLIMGQVSGKKWVADQMLLSRVKSFKPGTLVLVTTHSDSGKTFLRDIQMAASQPTAASGTPTPSKFDK